MKQRTLTVLADDGGVVTGSPNMTQILGMPPPSQCLSQISIMFASNFTPASVHKGFFTILLLQMTLALEKSSMTEEEEEDEQGYQIFGFQIGSPGGYDPYFSFI